jgi:hypothetical protein
MRVRQPHAALFSADFSAPNSRPRTLWVVPPAAEGRSVMARKKSGLGLLGWIGLIVLVLLVLAYLQQRHMIHLPVKLP